MLPSRHGILSKIFVFEKAISRHRFIRSRFLPLFCQALLLMASGLHAHAFDRLHPVMTRLPIAAASSSGDTGRAPLAFIHPMGMTVGKDCIYFLAWTDAGNQLWQYSILDGKTTLLAGQGGFQAKDKDPESALETHLGAGQAICVLKDGSILVAVNPRAHSSCCEHSGDDPAGQGAFSYVQRIIPGKPGEPWKATRFAGTNSTGNNVDANDPLKTQFSSNIVEIVECHDGSILVAEAQRMIRIHQDKVSLVLADKASSGHTFFSPLLALNDNTILYQPLRGFLDKVSIETGESHLWTPGFNAKPEGSVPRIVGLAQGREETAIVMWKTGGGLGEPEEWHLFRVQPKERKATLLAGPDSGRYPLDAHYLGQLKLNPWGGEMTVLSDGSILFLREGGIYLFSPNDPLQAVLEKIVKQGKVALQNNQPAVFENSQRMLALFAKPEDRSRHEDEEKAPAHPSPSEAKEDGMGTIQAEKLGVAERFRARLALDDLLAFKAAVGK